MVEIQRFNYQENLEAYKLACQNLGEFLEGTIHGSVNTPKGRKRQKILDAEVEKYGEESLYKTFDAPYLQGYTLVVSTLRILNRLNIHTDSELLELDSERAMKYTCGLGPKKAEIVGYFKDIISAEKDITL